jgi:hypothetical protein
MCCIVFHKYYICTGSRRMNEKTTVIKTVACFNQSACLTKVRNFMDIDKGNFA